jgi:hypothetical protein
MITLEVTCRVNVDTDNYDTAENYVTEALSHLSCTRMVDTDGTNLEERDMILHVKVDMMEPM